MQKQSAKIAILLVPLILLLANACSNISQTIETPVSVLTNQEALAQMYGSDISIQPNEASLTTTTGSTYFVRVNLLSCYRDNLGDERCLVITDKSTGYTCQLCGTRIDGAIFDQTSSGWKIRTLASDMIELTPNGQIPKGELIQIGPGKYAALLRGGYSIHGIERESLVIVAETEQSFGIVFHLLNSSLEYYTFDGEQGFTTQWGFTTKLEFQPDEENAEYDKIVVNYYGTAEDGKTPPLQIYKFTGTQYVLDYEEK